MKYPHDNNNKILLTKYIIMRKIEQILFMLAFSMGVTILTVIFLFVTGRQLPNLILVLISYGVVNIVGICLGYHKKLWEDFIEDS